jgi:hypothetical protein
MSLSPKVCPRLSKVPCPVLVGAAVGIFTLEPEQTMLVGTDASTWGWVWFAYDFDRDVAPFPFIELVSAIQWCPTCHEEHGTLAWVEELEQFCTEYACFPWNTARSLGILISLCMGGVLRTCNCPPVAAPAPAGPPVAVPAPADDEPDDYDDQDQNPDVGQDSDDDDQGPPKRMRAV